MPKKEKQKKEAKKKADSELTKSQRAHIERARKAEE